jgi:single-stranded-DNA-specific exonuclease
MRYELIGNNNFLEPIETVLENRGIEDIQSFLSISNQDVIHWNKLNNIEKAVDCLLDHVKKGSKIFIQVDADFDGYSSSAILINYLTNVFKDINIQWRVHEGKQHGIIVDTVPNDTSLVFIPDAGSNQYEKHKQLKEKGMDIIVLDHHECEKESDDAIVVNNQLSPEYPNKTLVGAAIVYKFLKALDNKIGIKHADHYLDLVACGLIADMADMRNLETRYYIQKGLAQINNKFLKELFNKVSFSTKGVINCVSVQFYIAPLINATVRTGNLQEKLQMMNAFLESKEQIYNNKKKESESIFTASARLLTNIKSRQARLRDKGAIAIEERIQGRNLLDNKVLIVNVTDILDKNLTGLVANILSKKYKRPVLLLRYDEEIQTFSGSSRGYEKGAIKDLRQFLLNTGKFEFVEGHPNAAGCQIKAENLLQANEIINEQLKEVEIDLSVYEVDFIIPSKSLTERFINEINRHKNIWGQKVEEPKIAIKDIEVNSDEIYLNGKTSKTIKFIHKGIEFIKFFSNEEEWNSLTGKGDRVILDVVGKCSINLYEGKEIPQIIMEDYYVTKVKKKELVF